MVEYFDKYNAFSGRESIRYGEFFEWLSDYWITGQRFLPLS